MMQAPKQGYMYMVYAGYLISSHMTTITITKDINSMNDCIILFTEIKKAGRGI